MTKVILHVTKAVITAITALLFFSCNMGSKLDGSGNVTKQNRPLKEEFKSISASEGLEVIIEQGAGRSVIVEADDNLHAHIKIEVKNGTLNISSDEDFANASTKRVFVTLPDIEKIESSTSALVTNKNILRGNSIELVSGSGGNIEITVEANDLSLESDSGGHLTVRGKAENLQTESSSGGHIDAKGLVAKNVEADSSSGGHTTVNPVESLSAQASSGGHVYYTTTPNKIDKKTSSGGNVQQD